MSMHGADMSKCALRGCVCFNPSVWTAINMVMSTEALLPAQCYWLQIILLGIFPLGLHSI